jgi:hypothetical protein
MAHVHQLVDHINKTLNNTYKDGYWVKLMVTHIWLDSADNMFIQGIDLKKYDEDKIDTSMTLRMMGKNHEDFLFYCNEYVDALYLDRDINIQRGQLALYFKVSPMLHHQGHFMPIIREVGKSEDEAKLDNIKSGLKVGLENKYLSRPELAGKVWSNEENEKLVSEFKKGNLSIYSIAITLKRTPLGCVEKLIELKVIIGREAWKFRNKIISELSDMS